MSVGRVPKLAAFVSVAALVLSACGGSSSSTTTKAASASSSTAAATSSAASTSSPAATSSSASTSSPAETSSSAATSSRDTSTPTAPTGAALSADTYALKLVPLAERWQVDAEHYGSVVSGSSTSLGVVSSASDTFVAATHRFADGIAALTPPRGAGAAQAKLVSALRSLANDVAELASAARTRNPSAAEQAQRNVSRDDAAVTSAVVALSAAARRGS